MNLDNFISPSGCPDTSRVSMKCKNLAELFRWPPRNFDSLCTILENEIWIFLPFICDLGHWTLSSQRRWFLNVGKGRRYAIGRLIHCSIDLLIAHYQRWVLDLIASVFTCNEERNTIFQAQTFWSVDNSVTWIASETARSKFSDFHCRF